MKKRAGKKEPAKKPYWPEPTLPLHSGAFDLENGWSATVPVPMCEETKDGGILLYSQGFLIQIESHGASGWPEPRERRYSELRRMLAESSFPVARDRNDGPMALIAFWLIAEKGPADKPLGMQAFALVDNGGLSAKIIFEAAEGRKWALEFVDSIRFSATR